MNVLITLLVIFLIGIVINKNLSPRISVNIKTDDVLLWYNGKNKREYIKLFKL